MQFYRLESRLDKRESKRQPWAEAPNPRCNLPESQGGDIGGVGRWALHRARLAAPSGFFAKPALHAAPHFYFLRGIREDI